MKISKSAKPVLVGSLAAVLLLLSALPSSTQAAADWSGTIGRLDMRTGYADTYLGTTHSQHDIVVRSSSGTSGNIVCVMDSGQDMFADFVRLATTAMLAGLDVTIKRHGSAQGQYKCSWISVAR